MGTGSHLLLHHCITRTKGKCSIMVLHEQVFFRCCIVLTWRSTGCFYLFCFCSGLDCMHIRSLVFWKTAYQICLQMSIWTWPIGNSGINMLKVSDTVFKNQLESRIPCYLFWPLVSKKYNFTVFFILNFSKHILKC